VAVPSGVDDAQFSWASQHLKLLDKLLHAGELEDTHQVWALPLSAASSNSQTNRSRPRRLHRDTRSGFAWRRLVIPNCEHAQFRSQKFKSLKFEE